MTADKSARPPEAAPSAGSSARDRVSQGEENFGPGDRVVFAVSRMAGSGPKGAYVEALRSQLSARGLAVSIHTNVDEAVAEISAVGDPASPRQEAPAEHRPRCCAVAAGGDGTLNLLASQLTPATPILPMPLGTENLVVRHFGLFDRRRIPDAEALADTITQGRTLRIDAGTAEFESDRGHVRNRKMFLIMASAGFDADVVRGMHLTRRGPIRRWSYFKPIFRSMRTYRYPKVRVVEQSLENDVAWTEGQVGEEPRAEGDRAEGAPLTVAWAFVFNLPRYAAGLDISPVANETDGVLDFCGFKQGSPWHAIRYLAGILTRRHGDWPDVVQKATRSVRLESDSRIAVQLDGDYAGRLPVTLRVLPARVALRLPRLPEETALPVDV